MKRLTRREEEIMQIIWRLKKAFVKEIISELPEPRPPYNTVSSVVRLLETNGFVSFTAFGKTHQYYPIVSKLEYRKLVFKSMLNDYFDGSFQQLASHFAKEEKLEQQDINALLELLDNDSEKE